MEKYTQKSITVKAKPMTLGDYNEYRGWEIPEEENPEDEGYLVHIDNHYTWKPKAIFEASHSLYGIDMTFGEALNAIKDGYNVTRKSWNDGVFIYSSVKLAEIGSTSATLAFKGRDGILLNPQDISICDCLANDWMIIE